MERRTRLSIVEYMRYLGGTECSRCVYGEEVLNAGHVILCGKLNSTDCEKFNLCALCLQTSALNSDPHKINGVLTLTPDGNLKISNTFCSRKAGNSGKCKHISAVLIKCTRSSKYGSCVPDRFKMCLVNPEKSNRPVPLKDMPCFKTKILPSNLNIDDGEMYNFFCDKIPNAAISLHRLVVHFTFQESNRVSTCALRHISKQHFQCQKFSHIEKDPYKSDKSKVPINNINLYTNRTHTCGELSHNNVGEKVVLCGWLQYQRLKRFIVLRDGYGVTQLIIKEKDFTTQQLLSSLPYESILKVEGVVVLRPENMVNKEQSTGTIEVLVDKLTVLNKANENLPFNLREYQKPKEPLRMQYRYLDLRFSEMQRNLRERSSILMNMREFLVNQASFVEVETPTLFKATPGGAQEYIVPTRFPGQFYSLVQSPQQFKQMLMAGGIDRYFQIARCYRDETSRPDRQPEFTQLDMEMSFTDRDGIKKLVEDLLHYSWPKFLNPLPPVFNTMTYQYAREKYGSDKPDTRFGFELQNVSNILQPTNTCNQVDFYSTCLVIGEGFDYTADIRNKLQILSEDYTNVQLIQSKITNKEDWIKSIGQKLTNDVVLNLWDQCHLKPDNIIFLAYGPRSDTLSLMGKVRIEYANLLEKNGELVRKSDMHITWITDFPLFEQNNESAGLLSVHHPFTSPHPDDVHLLETSPLRVRSLAYDLVLNGNEIGGGSIRIENSVLQEKILRLLDINTTKLQHILHMLASGCPPHGGIALGIDRLLSIILNTPSIRDVIAFPKTFEGRDPISGAPSGITDEEKKKYHIVTTS